MRPIPAWATWGQRQGIVVPRKRGVGENGLPLCRWCDNECHPPRRAWCSPECVDSYQAYWTWGAMRTFVLKRDAGTCQLCGTTDPPLPDEVPVELWPGGPVRASQYRFDPWDVDHIVRVADGGTDDPANLRLLCIPCHAEVTREQRGATGEGE